MNQQQNENNERLKENLSRIKKKYIVLSGKGGVGKSTVSVNLAATLNLLGKKVGILDVDIHGPSIAKMTGISGKRLELNKDGNPIPLKIKENFYVLTIAALLESDDTPVVWRGPLKMTAIKQFLNDIEWPELDYLIIDCPPGTGDEPLSAVQLIGKVNGSIIVSTPQEVAFLDARKTINFSRMLKVPVVGIVENMSGFKCPKCGEITYIFKSGGAEKAARDFGVDILGKVPFEIEMVESGDSGAFFVEKYPESEGAKVYKEIAMKIMEKEDSSIDKAEISSPCSSCAAKCNNNSGGEKMKVAIPLANGKLCMHFGHAENFGIYQLENGKIVNKEILTPPPHEPGVIPKWLSSLNVNIIIAGGMGSRAQEFFKEYGIKVLIGAASKAPEELIDEMVKGTIELGANVCDH